MAGKSQKITARQQRAITALLESSTIIAAAQKAGVGERTLQRWLAEDQQFQKEYARASRLLYSQSLRRLQKLSSPAVTQLTSILVQSGVSNRDRLLAIRTVLESGKNAVETEDYNNRLMEIEQVLCELKTKNQKRRR